MPRGQVFSRREPGLLTTRNREASWQGAKAKHQPFAKREGCPNGYVPQDLAHLLDALERLPLTRNVLAARRPKALVLPAVLGGDRSCERIASAATRSGHKHARAIPSIVLAITIARTLGTNGALGCAE